MTSNQGSQQLSPCEKIYKRHIMLPVDSSEHSERAFQWYVDQIYRKGDLVHIFHVVQPFKDKPIIKIDMHHPESKNETMWTVLQEDVQKGKKLNETYLNKAKILKVPARGHVHVDGKPWRAIIDSCKEYKCDQIVIGNRGISTLKSMFLGSVSNHIVHHAHIPVTVVPPDLEQKGNEHTISNRSF